LERRIKRERRIEESLPFFGNTHYVYTHQASEVNNELLVFAFLRLNVRRELFVVVSSITSEK
jgi:hypothetical protein